MLVSAVMVASVATLVAGEAPALGTPVRQDGYSLRPPSPFRMVRMDPYRATRVGAVALSPGAGRFLSAALVDGEGQDAATMLVSVVDGSFEASPSMRDDFSAAVARHFAEELGLDFQMLTAERAPGQAPRIEVLGTVRQGAQLRYVLVAGMEGEGRHAVVTFSAPSGRWEALRPTVRSSLDSFQSDAPPSGTGLRTVAGAAAGALLGALVVSIAAWRRRRERR